MDYQVDYQNFVYFAVMLKLEQLFLNYQNNSDFANVK